MKILFCTDSLNRGGAEKQMTLLATQLALSGHSIQVFSSNSGSYIGDLQSQSVQVTVCHNPKSFRCMRETARKILKRFHPDVVHFWSSRILLICLGTVKQFRIPTVNGFIRFGMLSGSFSSKLRTLVCARLGDLVVANSKSGLKVCRVINSKGRILQNGFDLKRLQTGKSVELDPTLCHVVMCANITRFKNHNLLIDSAKLAVLTNSNTPLCFHIIGKPIPEVELPPLLQKSADLIKSGHIRFHGSIDEPIPFLQAADIGILLSTRGEGISNSIMEYMATSLPIVCTDVNGNRELLGENCGIFLKEDTPQEVLKTLTFLANKPAIRSKMASCGLTRIRDCYSLSAMTQSAMNIYKEVVRDE